MIELLKIDRSLFNTFTAIDEYNTPLLDKHSRYMPALKNIIDFPMVSEYLIKNGYKVSYPDDKPFAVCLTHDIDDIYPPISHTITSSVYLASELKLKALYEHLFWKLKGKEHSPYWNFNDIMDLEAKYGAKSTFFFLSTDRDIKRYRYCIEDLKDELRHINKNGWDIGLHGGYYAYNDLTEIVREKNSLEKVLGDKIAGYRNHYLRFKTPDTWELLSQAGFKYDSTFGYHAAIGFRNGVCHPFKPFNVNTNNSIEILEIPLNVMDGALFYNKVSLSDAWASIRKLIDTVERYSGVITLLWHNNVFSNPVRRDWLKLYDKVLDYCHEKNAWLTNCNEVWSWYKTQD